MARRSPCALARRARACTFAKTVRAIAARIPMTATTTITSISVKPPRLRNGIRDALGLVGALELRAQAVELFRIEPHAEREPHLAEDGLDLVQRLLAEVLRLEQLRLGLLHEVGDR